MKKIIKTMVSMLATVTMLLSAASFSVLADTTGEGLIFDLDLTGSTAEKLVVSNAADTTTQTLWGAEESHAPAVGTINGIPYLKFRQNKDDSNAATDYIKVVNNDFVDQNNMTFEFWARPQCLNADQNAIEGYRMAAMAIGGSADTDRRFDVFFNGSNMHYRPSGQESERNYEMHSKLFNLNLNGSWTHFVFTRKWVPSAADSTTGTWQGAVYVNGVEIEAAAVKGSDSVTRQKDTQDNTYLIIGNHYNLKQSFLGDIAEVKVYNTLLSDSTIAAKYTDRKSAYDALTVKSVSPSANLSTVGGTMQAVFSEAINARTLSGITLKAADGTAVPVSVSLKDDGVTAVITYGVLTEGTSYTLTLPSSVKSYSEKSLEEATYTFTAAKKDMIVDTDFSEMQTVPNLAGMTYETPNNETYISIQQTIDGSDSYLAVSGKTDEAGKNFKVKHTLQNQFSNNSVTGDQYVIEMKLRRTLTGKNAEETAKNVAGDVFNVSCEPASIKLGEISYKNILPYYNWSYSDTENKWVKSANHLSVLDDNGFATLRLVITADEVDGTKVFGFEQYDNGTYIEGSRLDPRAAGVTAPTKIHNVTLAHIYTQDTDNAYAENDFSAFKIYERRQTQILSFGEYDEATNTVTMALSNDLKDGEAEKITVKNSQNEAVAATATAGSNNTVTLAFTAPLSGTYTVSLNEAVDADGILCSSRTADFVAVGSPAATVSYTDENGNELTTLENQTTVMATATLSNWTDAENIPVGFLAVYDGGKLVGLKQASSNVEGTTVNFEASVKDLTALSDKANAKFMIVKSLASLAPVVSADDFQSANGGSL